MSEHVGAECEHVCEKVHVRERKPVTKQVGQMFA